MAKLHATQAHGYIEELESRVAHLKATLTEIAQGEVEGVYFAEDDLISAHARRAVEADDARERLWDTSR